MKLETVPRLVRAVDASLAGALGRTGASVMTSRRLLIVLASCAVLVTCRAAMDTSNTMVADIPPRDEATRPPAMHGALPVDWERQALVSTGRVDAQFARLAVSKVVAQTDDPILRIDALLAGPCEWAMTLADRAGLTVRAEDDVWLVSAAQEAILRSTLRHLIGRLDEGLTRLKSNLVDRAAIGHKKRVGRIEQTVIGGPSAIEDDLECLDLSQGPLATTQHVLDLAIWGRGFFELEVVDGSVPRRLYTRDGRLVLQPNGTLASRSIAGASLLPPLEIPPDARDLQVLADGRLLAKGPLDLGPREVGRLTLVWFERPELLSPAGGSLYARTTNAGELTAGHPGEAPFGKTLQGKLEQSNVNPVELWAQIAGMEDARQLMAAMLAQVQSPTLAPVAVDHRVSPRSRTVSLPLFPPLPWEREPTLVRFLRLRGIDSLTGPDTIDLAASPESARALVAYLRHLRRALAIVAENIAHADGEGRGAASATPYRRRYLDLDEAGQSCVLEDLSPLRGSDIGDTPSVEIDSEMADADLLTESYRAVREALRDIGEAAVPALAELLGDSESESRCDAAWALGQMGADAVAAVPTLVGLLGSEESMDRRAAASALGHIAPDHEPVMKAVAAMWTAALDSQDLSERYAAAMALGRLGPRAAAAVPKLVAMLEDPRSGACRALGGIGSAAKPAVPALVRLLEGPDARLREQAADALGRIGPAAAEAVSALVRAMKDENMEVRWRCAAAVSSIGSGDSGCLAAVAELLQLEDAYVRGRVAEVLGRLVGASSEMRSALGEAVQQSSPTEPLWPLLVLTMLGEHEGMTTASLTSLFMRESAPVRAVCCRSLGKLGRLARPALPVLLQLTRDADETVAVAALEAVLAVGPEGGPKAAAMLAVSLSSGNPLVRIRAATALGRLGSGAEAAVPALVAVLEEPVESVTVASLEALARIGPGAVSAVPNLTRLKGHPSAAIRENAAQALAAIMEHASPGAQGRLAADGEGDRRTP